METRILLKAKMIEREIKFCIGELNALSDINADNINTYTRAHAGNHNDTFTIPTVDIVLDLRESCIEWYQNRISELEKELEAL